jgi:hypothetical protein
MQDPGDDQHESQSVMSGSDESGDSEQEESDGDESEDEVDYPDRHVVHVTPPPVPPDLPMAKPAA